MGGLFGFLCVGGLVVCRKEVLSCFCSSLVVSCEC